MPTFGDDLQTHYWLGRSADGTTFGKAYDAWVAAQSDANSVPARLMARFEACEATSPTRHAYLTLP